MKQITRHLTTSTAKNSSLFYFGSLFINFGRYLFHLLLLRFLSPSSYGEFLSYVSLLYLLTIPSGVIQTLVSRDVSLFFGKQDFRSIKHFFYFLSPLALVPALLISVLVIFFANPLAHLLTADPAAFIVLSLMTITSILGAVLRSYLPALQRFTTQVLIGFIELLILIASAYLFLIFKLGALSGVLAMFLSGVIAILLSGYLLRSYLLPKPKKVGTFKINHIFLYSLIFSAGTLSLMSTDILLVRYFFSSHDSGLYSALSVIGRMIFFGLTPIGSLILPIAASRYASKQSTSSVYLKLILSAGFLGIGAVSLFSLFPDLVVRLLSGSEYLAITSLIPFISLTMFFLSLNQLTLSYLLAVGKEKGTYLLFFFALLQPLLIIFIHSSLYQVITLNLTLQLCLFITLVIYNTLKKV